MTPRPTCRLCGDAITFAKTEKGHRMPLNIGADPEGNCYMENGVVKVLAKDDPRRFDGSLVLLQSHFATCARRRA